MADNVTIGSADGVDIAFDDVSGVEHQLVKIEWGTDGVATMVSASNPLPVTADTELTTADLNTGAGTDTRAVVGLVGTTSTGGELIPGDATDGLLTQISTMPGAALDTDTQGVAIRTDSIAGNLVGYTPKFAAITSASSGNNTVVAAVTSKKIRVLAAVFTSSGTVNGKFQSGASGTDLTGLFYMVANVGAVLPFNPVGWFETAAGVLLNFNLSGGVTTGGCLTYIEV